MKIMLDTSVLIFSLSDPNKLNNKTKSLISNPSTELFVSLISIWEIIIKRSIGKLSIEIPIDLLVSKLNLSGIKIITIEIPHLKILSTLEMHHKYPFDRILIAQSISENIPILTSDLHFQKYPVELIYNKV